MPVAKNSFPALLVSVMEKVDKKRWGRICQFLKNCFEQLENTLNKAFSKVDNIIVLGDINIDCRYPIDNDYLNTFCETFNLKNLIHLFTVSNPLFSFHKQK